jgi:hypothetical protein
MSSPCNQICILTYHNCLYIFLWKFTQAYSQQYGPDEIKGMKQMRVNTPLHTSSPARINIMLKSLYLPFCLTKVVLSPFLNICAS